VQQGLARLSKYAKGAIALNKVEDAVPLALVRVGERKEKEKTALNKLKVVY
jgi:hypothetical protein